MGLTAAEIRPFDITIVDPIKRIQHYIDRYRNDENYKGFEAVLMRNIRIVTAENATSGAPRDDWMARAAFEVDVVPELCNPMGNMHGGAVALTADMATTMAAAPASTKGFWEFGGVSRTLAVTFLAPLLKGSVVEVECKLRGAGKRLSIIQCEFRDKKSRTLLAVAEHGKVAIGDQIQKSSQERKPKL